MSSPPVLGGSGKQMKKYIKQFQEELILLTIESELQIKSLNWPKMTSSMFHFQTVVLFIISDSIK